MSESDSRKSDFVIGDHQKWLRISPISIVYFLFSSAKHIFNAWPGIVALWAAGETVRSYFWAYGLPAIIGLIVLSLLLQFWFFRFKIEKDRIQIHSGALSRKKLNLDFERVQQADIAQPFYFRPFGLATLGLESAGSSQQEVNIPGIPYKYALELKAFILAHRDTLGDSAKKTDQVSESSDASSSSLTYKRSSEVNYELRLPWTEVARHGLMHNGLLLFLAFLYPITQRAGDFFEELLLRLEGTVLMNWAESVQAENTVWVMVFIAFIVITLGIIVLFLASIVIALFMYWDYHLTRVEDQYQYRAGLATIKTRGFRLHKLQQVTIYQGLIARLLRRYTLSISKAGRAVQSGGEQGSKKFLIPVLKIETLEELKQQLNIPSPQWQRVSPLFIFWNTFIVASLISVPMLSLLLVNELPLWWTVSSYTVFGLFFWRRWACLGVHQDQNWLAVKSGFIGIETIWLPIGKAQKMQVSQPPWLKSSGLANLNIWGADGNIYFPFIPLNAAKTVRDRTLEKVVTFKGKWF
ncbi:hypothetical protein NBRC116493_19520 [Aurantivibrio infirmus]